MAEIPVTQKSGGLPWLWVILFLIAAAVALWLLFANGDDDDLQNETDDVEDVQPAETSSLDLNGGHRTIFAGFETSTV